MPASPRTPGIKRRVTTTSTFVHCHRRFTRGIRVAHACDEGHVEDGAARTTDGLGNRPFAFHDLALVVTGLVAGVSEIAGRLSGQSAVRTFLWKRTIICLYMCLW